MTVYIVLWVIVYIHLLRFYEENVLRSNYEECQNYLKEFNLSIDMVRPLMVCFEMKN